MAPAPFSPSPCPQSCRCWHSPQPPAPHRVPDLFKVLRSLVVFPVTPVWWGGTAVGCPSPILLIPREVVMAREGFRGWGPGLQQRIMAGEYSSKLRCLVLLQLLLPTAVLSSLSLPCSQERSCFGHSRCTGEPRQCHVPSLHGCSPRPLRPYRLPSAPASPVLVLPGRLIPDDPGATRP